MGCERCTEAHRLADDAPPCETCPRAEQPAPALQAANATAWRLWRRGHTSRGWSGALDLAGLSAYAAATRAPVGDLEAALDLEDALQERGLIGSEEPPPTQGAPRGPSTR